MLTDQKIIKNRLRLINLARRLGDVSQACKVMGYSWDSFFRLQQPYDQGEELALQRISRKKPCPKNRVKEQVKKAVAEFTIQKLAYGQLKVSNELKKKGLFVSNLRYLSNSLTRTFWITSKILNSLLLKMLREKRSYLDNLLLPLLKIQLRLNY